MVSASSAVGLVPEEALGGGVVRRAALGAHGTRQPVAFADADPSGPAVMTAPVRVDDGMLAVLEGGACLLEHGVGQFGRRAGADAPCHGHAVVAVDDRAEGVDDGMLAVLEGGACLLEHGVGQFGRRAGADAPCHGHAVVAVDDRAEVYLSFTDAELGDVGLVPMLHATGMPS